MEHASQPRQIDILLAKYAESHQNPTNELIHFVCIPAIVFSLLGILWAIHPVAALASLGVFVVVLLLSRFVSLGSILAAISFPLILLLGLFGAESNLLIGFGAVLALLVLYTHRQNIKRLLSGKENKVKLW